MKKTATITGVAAVLAGTVSVAGAEMIAPTVNDVVVNGGWLEMGTGVYVGGSAASRDRGATIGGRITRNLYVNGDASIRSYSNVEGASYIMGGASVGSYSNINQINASGAVNVSSYANVTNASSGSTVGVASYASVSNISENTLGAGLWDQSKLNIRSSGAPTAGSVAVDSSSAGGDGALAAGSYGSLNLGNYQSLRLTAGHYVFASLQLNSYSRLIADATEGAVTIEVVGDANFSSYSEIVGNGDSGAIVMAHGNVNANSYTELDASVAGFGDAVNIGSYANINGSVYAEARLSIGSYASIQGGGDFSTVPSPASTAVFIVAGMIGAPRRRRGA